MPENVEAPSAALSPTQSSALPWWRSLDSSVPRWSRSIPGSTSGAIGTWVRCAHSVGFQRDPAADGSRARWHMQVTHPRPLRFRSLSHPGGGTRRPGVISAATGTVLDGQSMDPARREAMYDDLLAVPDHLIAEILAGELVTSPRPGWAHANAASAIGQDLGGFHRRPGQPGGPGGWWIVDE